MSTCCTPDTFWSDQLAEAKQAVIDLRARIRKTTADGLQSYRLSTGQTDESAMKIHLATLQASLDSALNEVATLEARICGAVTHTIPGW